MALHSARSRRKLPFSKSAWQAVSNSFAARLRHLSIESLKREIESASLPDNHHQKKFSYWHKVVYPCLRSSLLTRLSPFQRTLTDLRKGCRVSPPLCPHFLSLTTTMPSAASFSIYFLINTNATPPAWRKRPCNIWK